MSPRWSRLARQNGQVLVALAALLGFTAVHLIVFAPAAIRYRRAVARAEALGIQLNEASGPSALSGRAAALFTGNSLDSAAAEEREASGVLAGVLLENLSGLAARRGIEILATERDIMTALPSAVQVRARLQLRGRYADFVALLGDLPRSGALTAIDRFNLQHDTNGNVRIEVWVSQLVFKRERGTR